MYTVIVILILLVCIALALVVLVQNSKGGGLAATVAIPRHAMDSSLNTEVDASAAKSAVPVPAATAPMATDVATTPEAE